MTLPSKYVDKKRREKILAARLKDRAEAEKMVNVIVKRFRDDLERKALIISTMKPENIDREVLAEDVIEAAQQLAGFRPGEGSFGFQTTWKDLVAGIPL